MNTESVDISISSKSAFYMLGAGAKLSANEEYFTLTDTDSQHAGKYDKSGIKTNIKLLSLRIYVKADDDEQYFISARTKETLSLSLVLLLAAIIAAVGVFLFDLVWWAVPAILFIYAFHAAYLVQKLVQIRGLLS